VDNSTDPAITDLTNQVTILWSSISGEKLVLHFLSKFK
jgi:hypothetical protein